ncbi:MAG: response regulator transcription factor [Actinobacteria bacterium]|nr:response regulator transcription factor [Actinomycetota bacterium]
MSLDRISEEPTSICVCSPNEPFLEAIADFLSDAGFGPLPAANGSAALRLCRYVRVEILVLDLAFPEGVVLDVLGRISDPDFPRVGAVLLLTDRKASGEDLAALRDGETLARVDDYLAKPFSLEELHARIRTILRRRHSREEAVFRLGELVVDPPRRRVTVGDREVRLAKKEFVLLRALASDPTHVFSKDELMRAVWSLRYPAGRTRTLDSHASRLRNKLDPVHKRFVANCWGVGYRLVESVEDAGPVVDDHRGGEEG